MTEKCISQMLKENKQAKGTYILLRIEVRTLKESKPIRGTHILSSTEQGQLRM
jgi:hypothetical protein